MLNIICKSKQTLTSPLFDITISTCIFKYRPVYIQQSES